jgi:nitrogen fixation NifU-like protein
MADLRELYQEVIFDHYKNPRNFRKIANANRTAEGFNPLCGDELIVYLNLSDQGVIEEVSFEGKGCAISTASASLMTEILRGKTTGDAEKLFKEFHSLVTGTDENIESSELGKLQVLVGVRGYPARVKCATLAWHTIHAALNNQTDKVTTE